VRLVLVVVLVTLVPVDLDDFVVGAGGMTDGGLFEGVKTSISPNVIRNNEANDVPKYAPSTV